MTHSHSGGPTADVSVRIAWADDAESIAAVQVRAWPELYAGLLPAEAVDPDCDPVADGELAEVTLDPAERAKGHGSRLLQAAVDTLAADRFTRAVTWVNAGDDALRTFLTDAGWAADTAHRELDLDGTGTTTVKQVRLHTAIG